VGTPGTAGTNLAQAGFSSKLAKKEFFNDKLSQK